MAPRPGQKLTRFSAEDDAAILAGRSRVPPRPFGLIGDLLTPERGKGTVRTRYIRVLLRRARQPPAEPRLGLGITLDMVRARR